MAAADINRAAETLGGSSSINAMFYVRGNRWDYDHWASLGNPGWSYDDVLPLFTRAENNEEFKDDFHGQGGPLNVTYPRNQSPLTKLFLRQLPCTRFGQILITTEPSKRVPSNTRSLTKAANAAALPRRT